MQGFNMGRYVPPDVEGTTTGNKLHKKKPPSFARDGTQTVRFEMPFAVWCQHCPKPTIIGQGVRFNATKRKVGAYHSTPVFAFRMRHADCGGAIEIRTDPQHTTYAVVEGAKKRDTGEDGGGDLVSSGVAAEPILTDKERENLRSNAFAKLEKTIEDRQVLERAKERIGELEDESARRWEDPYERNRALRAAFRVGRRERERDAQTTDDLRNRMSLGMDLLPASEEDARRAALVDFGPSSADGSEDASMGRKALAKPLFFANQPKHAPPADDGKAKKKRLKSEVAAAQMRDTLVSEIVGNTRVAQDPFLSVDRGSRENTKSASRITSIKRKRLEAEREPGSEKQDEATAEKGKDESEVSKGASLLTTLVEYDSD
ncbi:ubiquitin-conjugating enzyme E2 H [Hypoxylon texense]